MHFRWWACGVALCCLLLATVFYPLTLTVLAKFLLLSQQPQAADLILILGGDFYGPRAIAGAELGSRGFAPKVLISGPPYQNQPESEFSIRYLADKGYRRDLFISFPNTSKETIGEAIDVCAELKRRGARKVLIVTSAYHSRRANIVYNLFCPGVHFRSIGAPDEQFQADHWWKTPRYRKVFFSEWQKILATVLWKYPEYNLKRLW